jgi:hypothetical protein
VAVVAPVFAVGRVRSAGTEEAEEGVSGVAVLAPKGGFWHGPAPVSESASHPAVAQDPVLSEVPAKLWLRSGRPFWGTATRVYVPFALITGALLFVPRGRCSGGWSGSGWRRSWLFPLVIQGLLTPIERRVIAASRREATGVLREIRQLRLVRLFAPFAWTTLQEARLHLRRGDGKAAVRAFAETARLSRPSVEAAKVEPPALISMQAHALLIAEQPEQARELLQALAKRQTLAPIDQLHLGLALQAGKGHNRESLEHIEAAAAGARASPAGAGRAGPGAVPGRPDRARRWRRSQRRAGRRSATSRTPSTRGSSQRGVQADADGAEGPAEAGPQGAEQAANELATGASGEGA